MKELNRRTLSVLLALLLTGALFACAGGGINVGQRNLVAPPDLKYGGKQLPLSVAMSVDENLMVYVIRFGSTTALGGDIISTYTGLDNLLSQVLNIHFESVEPVGKDDAIAEDDYDLVARMTVDSTDAHCGIPMIKDKEGKVTMTFTFEKTNGETVFSRTLSGAGSMPTRRAKGATGCEDIVDAFEKAFHQIFIDLNKAINESDAFDSIG